jgi:hypothetical protein
MNLLNTILQQHSKSQTDRIVKWIGQDQKRFDELFELFMYSEPVVMQRSGWPLSYAVEQQPVLIKKHLARIIKNLRNPNLHEAVKRNTVRILQFTAIPGRLHGEVMDLCFRYISDPKEKPAAKAFALTVLDNLTKQYPEIGNELKTVIEERWDHETPAFHSRARKILKSL